MDRAGGWQHRWHRTSACPGTDERRGRQQPNGSQGNKGTGPGKPAGRLALGEFMLISRFNLLAGVSAGGDPAACPGEAGSGCGPFEMSPLGWFLIMLPFIIFVVGLVLGVVRRDKENYDAVHNFV